MNRATSNARPGATALRNGLATLLQLNHAPLLPNGFKKAIKNANEGLLPPQNVLEEMRVAMLAAKRGWRGWQHCIDTLLKDAEGGKAKWTKLLKQMANVFEKAHAAGSNAAPSVEWAELPSKAKMKTFVMPTYWQGGGKFVQLPVIKMNERTNFIRTKQFSDGAKFATITDTAAQPLNDEDVETRIDPVNNVKAQHMLNAEPIVHATLKAGNGHVPVAHANNVATRTQQQKNRKQQIPNTSITVSLPKKKKKKTRSRWLTELTQAQQNNHSIAADEHAMDEVLGTKRPKLVTEADAQQTEAVAQNCDIVVQPGKPTTTLQHSPKQGAGKKKKRKRKRSTALPTCATVHASEPSATTTELSAAVSGNAQHHIPTSAPTLQSETIHASRATNAEALVTSSHHTILAANATKNNLRAQAAVDPASMVGTGIPLTKRQKRSRNFAGKKKTAPNAKRSVATATSQKKEAKDAASGTTFKAIHTVAIARNKGKSRGGSRATK